MFLSTSCWRGNTTLPAFAGVRIMMMPVILGDMTRIPDFLQSYRAVISDLFRMAGHQERIGYLTIDEKLVSTAQTHRRQGLHVDGVHRGRMGAWGGGGSWGSVGNGMLTVSSHALCRVFNQPFSGFPGLEGECDHLAEQCDASRSSILGAGEVHWLDGLCVHESLPAEEDIRRQFVRLSLPSNGPWFEGYTKNPCGVMPSGEILPNRFQFYSDADMDHLSSGNCRNYRSEIQEGEADGVM